MPDSPGIIGAMIVLSVGMPRAGSGWYYNLTNELMLANGAQDAHHIRQRYRLQNILTEVNCNIGALSTPRLLAVLVPALSGNTFVIKAHCGPTPFARLLIRLGWLRACYIYRDPRDALLSAFENGERARQRGHTNAFSHLVDFDAGLKFMREYVQISQAWLSNQAVLHARYESLLTDYDLEAGHLVDFLKIDGQKPETQQVIEKFRPKSARPEQKGLHFSQGKIGRFRQKMTPEELQTMRRDFGPYLQNLGYEL